MPKNPKSVRSNRENDKKEYPTFDFTFSRLLEVAQNTAERKEPFCALISVVFSAAALESLINDLVALVNFTHNPKHKKLQAFASILRDLEEGRGRITAKYQIARLIFSASNFNKGTQPFQDFDLLFRVRNAIAHPTPDVYVTNWEGYTVGVRNRNQKLIKILADKNLCECPDKFRRVWVRYFENDSRLAMWAHQTATAMIKEIFTIFPRNSMAYMILGMELQKISVIEKKGNSYYPPEKQ